MNLIEQVYGSLKWKKSDTYCAAKLGIALEEYQELKAKILVAKNDVESELDEHLIDAILYKLDAVPNDALVKAAQSYQNKVVEFKEDLDSGTAEIKGIAVSEPRSPEEIIKILKIDETKWKLSTYWNKEHKDHWVVSAMVTRVKKEPKDFLKETLEQFNPQYTPVSEVHINTKFENPVVGVLSIQDLHFGKEGNTDIIDAFKQAVVSLVMRSYHAHRVEEIIYVFGGDLLNMDTFMGQTTKGTPVDNDLRAQEAYNQAFDALYWSVNYIKQFCNRLQVVYLPGNHDRLSSYHLAHGLSKCFVSDSNIIFDVQYAERKVKVFGQNFFGFEHGDVTKKWTPLVYATEFPVQWGSTAFRTCYTGHFHSKKTTEYVTDNEVHGFAIKHLPSLCKSDYWHYHNKFIGSKRQAVMEIHDLFMGKVSEFTYNA